MNEAPTAIAIASAPLPRPWIPLVTVILAILGSVIVVGGLVLTVGAWRARVDEKLEDHDRKIATIEATQSSDGRDLVGIKKDVSFLAERARREDDRQDRERQ